MIGGRSYLNSFIFQTCSFGLKQPLIPLASLLLFAVGVSFAWECLLSLQPDCPKESGRERRWESGVALRALGDGPRKPAMQSAQVCASRVKGYLGPQLLKPLDHSLSLRDLAGESRWWEHRE